MNGAIALVMLPYGRHSRVGAGDIKSRLDEAVGGGARAAILVTEGPTGETIRLNAAYSEPVAPIPVVLVGPKNGAFLMDAAERGGECHLIVDGTPMQRESANILGRLRRDGSNHLPTVVISTPRTGWTRCVGERGPGLALFLALAEWAPSALRQSDLLFVSTAAHEYDNEGGIRFMRNLAPPPEEVKLWVHLGSGFGARNYHETGKYSLQPMSSAFPQRFLVGSDEMVPALKKSFAGLSGLEDVYPASAGAAGELMEIFGHGYGPALGLFAGHYFHHTAEDRMDKVDPQFIYDVGVRIFDLVGAIS